MIVKLSRFNGNLLFVCALFISGCGYNLKLQDMPVAHRRNTTVRRIEQTSPNLNISGKVLVDEFAYKVPRNKKGDSLIIYNPDPTYFLYSADSLVLNSYTRKDSIYLRPKGQLEIDFRNRLTARIGILTLRMKNVRLDTSSNSLRVNFNPLSLGVRFRKFDRFQNIKKFSEEAVINVATNLNISVPNLTNIIDKELRRRGNLGNCEKKVYWKGHTTVHSASKNKIVFESRVQFKRYKCASVFGKKMSTKLFSKTQTIKWDLTISKRKQGQVNFKWNVQDVDDFPGSLEKILRDKLFGNISIGLKNYYTNIIALNLKPIKKNNHGVTAVCEIEFTAQ